MSIEEQQWHVHGQGQISAQPGLDSVSSGSAPLCTIQFCSSRFYFTAAESGASTCAAQKYSMTTITRLSLSKEYYLPRVSFLTMQPRQEPPFSWPWVPTLEHASSPSETKTADKPSQDSNFCRFDTLCPAIRQTLSKRLARGQMPR